MRAVFFDCPTGASGNMILASLLDAGADRRRVAGQLQKIPVKGWKMRLEQVTRQGVGGLHLVVDCQGQPERNLSDIIRLVKRAKYKTSVEERIIEAFTTLARAEARVHRTTVTRVHFHEVGAIDSIIDIAGTMLALDDLGVEKVFCSPLNVGKGTVKCRHGVLPVPAPATALLLKKASIYQNHLSGELVTPTGALLMVCLAESFGPLPAMTLASVGHGAGTRDLPEPNILRAMVGEQAALGNSRGRMVLLETNIDDMNPQIMGYLMDLLLKAGAADVYFAPVQMKKGRPGTVLSVMVAEAFEPAAVNIIMRETTTLGVRRQAVERYVLPREKVKVSTRYGLIAGKLAELPQGGAKFQPEYDSCRAASQKHQVPLRMVMDAAIRCWKG